MRTLLFALVLLGCNSKSKDAPPPPTQPPAPAPEAAKPQPPPSITCDRGIPKALADKFIPGATTEHGEPLAGPDGMLTSCRFQEKEPDRRTVVQFRCGDEFASLGSYLDLIESQVSVKYQRFPTPGRGAYQSSRTFGTLHRTLPCIIEAEGMRGDPMIDLKGFVTEIEAQLK